MAKTRLKGDDGKVVKVTLGAEETSGTTLDAGSLYLITGIDASASALPGAIEVGYIFKAVGTESLAGDDAVKKLTTTDLCDLRSFSLDFSKGEIEVTTLCDDQKKYVVGKSDATGNMEGVYTIGTSDQADGIQNKFVDIATIDATGTFNVSKLDDDSLYVQLYTQADNTSGETVEFYFMPIQLTTFNQGATVDDNAQTFSSGFRIAPDETNGVKTCYYKEVIA